MSENEIYEKLNEIFRDIFDDDSIELTPETTAGDIEDWDSLTHINIIVAVESAFNVKFSIAEVKELKHIGDMTRLIQERL